MDQNPFFPRPIASACLLLQVLDDKPRVTDYYPPSFQNEAILNHASLFCFPEKTIQSSTFKSEPFLQCWRYHNFVCTGSNGERYYGHCLRFSTQNLSSSSPTSTVNPSIANSATDKSPRDRATSVVEIKNDIDMFLEMCCLDTNIVPREEDNDTTNVAEEDDATRVFTISNQSKGNGKGVSIGIRGVIHPPEPKKNITPQEQPSKSHSDFVLDAAVCILSSAPLFNTIRTWLFHTWKEALSRPQLKPFEPRLVALLHEMCLLGSPSLSIKLALKLHNSIKPHVYSENVTVKTSVIPDEKKPTDSTTGQKFSTPVDENSYQLILTLPNMGTDVNFPELDLSLSTFIRLSPKTIAKIFAALLLERKILIISQRGITPVVHTCEAFLQFLWPLQWPHTYIPLLTNQLLEVVQAPVPYLIGISHQVIPAADFNAMLQEQRQFDLEVADLIVNIDTDTITEFSEEVNDANDDEFVEVNLNATTNTTLTPTLNPNTNRRLGIGRHKSSKTFKWKGAKSNVPSLPKNVAARLKQRLRHAIEYETFTADIAYIPNASIFKNERNLKRRLQLAFFMTYLDLLAECDLQDKEAFLIRSGSRNFYDRWFSSMAFARFEEDKEIAFTPAKFLASLVGKPIAKVKTTLARAFGSSEISVTFTEFPCTLPSFSDKKKHTKTQPEVKVLFKNELFPPLRYDRYIQQISECIQKNANKADYYVLRLYYYAQIENHEKFLEDFGSLVQIDPKHPILSSKILSTLFSKMPKETLEKARAKYPQLQRILEESEPQEIQREKSSSEDWISVDQSTFKGDLSYLEKLPLPDQDLPNPHDIDSQLMSKADFTRYLLNNKICDNIAVATRLFEILGGNVKRNTVPLRTVKQLIQCLKEQQYLTRTSWEKMSASIPPLNDADSINAESKSSSQETVLLYASPVTYFVEPPSVSNLAHRPSTSDNTKDILDTKGILFLTDLRLIFVPLTVKPEVVKNVIEIRLKAILRVEKYNYVRKPLAPPLECVRIIRNIQHSKGTNSALELLFFARAGRTTWLKSITEILNSQKVSYDLDDASFSRRAFVAIILAHALKKLTISMSKLEPFFIFQDFYQSNSYYICKALISQGTLNTVYKWEEPSSSIQSQQRQRRDPCEISADILTKGITLLYSYFDTVPQQQRFNLVNSSSNTNSLVMGIKRVFSGDKKEFDMTIIRGTKEFDDFTRSTAEYQVINISKLSETERMTFLINLYNTMVIHGLFYAGFPRSTLDWRYFARFTCYNVGGFPITLDGVLRLLRGTEANSSREGADKVFKNNDPRLQWALTRLDPRLHFTLCLFNIFSPSVYIITPSKLEHRLQFATETYCQTFVKFDPSTREITLPKLFSWYANDFGDNAIKWVANFLPADRAMQLRNIITSGNYSVNYDYSWEPIMKPKQK
jgi:hypothetical protein